RATPQPQRPESGKWAGAIHRLSACPPAAAGVAHTAALHEGSLTKDGKEIMQFLIDLFRGGDRLRNLSANQFAVTLPQSMYRHLDRSFAHLQCRGDVGVASLAFF